MQLISPKECQIGIEKNELEIIDIRETYEFENANISCKHIPMAELSSRISELDFTKKTVLMCGSGKRAEALANFIETEKIAINLFVMNGGILAWIETIDSSIKLD
jgi:rhodanese-related sulfurtransferase